MSGAANSSKCESRPSKTKSYSQAISSQLGCTQTWHYEARCGRCLFDQVEPPEKIFSMQELLGTRRFLTRHNWNMESVFCSNSRSQSIVVVRGPSALKKSQVVSSVACVLVAVVAVGARHGPLCAVDDMLLLSKIPNHVPCSQGVPTNGRGTG